MLLVGGFPYMDVVRETLWYKLYINIEPKDML